MKENIMKALNYLHDKGYTTQFEDTGNIIAYNNDSNEYYKIMVSTTGEMPAMRISSDMVTYDVQYNKPLDVLALVNACNKNRPFMKFTMNLVEAGDYALVRGGNPEDLVFMSIEAEVLTFFGTSEQMLIILDDALSSFKSAKESMPDKI
ncbi:MAG: hypothetical protein K2H18_04575 [Muribaculaceae bacterium]|nr:hypothetical protein [Muribaculaceae bacterium]